MSLGDLSTNLALVLLKSKVYFSLKSVFLSAEKETILLQTMEGYSWLQGLYPRTNIGDQFIRLKRSAKQPNMLSQTVKELEPGRLYSLKIVAIDKNNMDKK